MAFLQAGRAQIPTATTLDRILVGALVLAYVMLPLDRGFPTIPILGHPLSPAIAATMSVFVLFVIRSRGQVLQYLRDPYAIGQTAYSVVLVVSALRATAPLAALHWATLYISTFVLNYAVIRHVLAGRAVTWFTVLVVIAALGAASVGIAQSVVGLQLPAYDAWFENYFRRPPENAALSTVRASGTMSNPILYCMLMLLAVPYALSIKAVAIRAVALWVILFAAGLSGSRTAVPVLMVFVAGAIAVWRWRVVRAWPAIAAGLALLVWSVGWLVQPGQTSRAAFLTERSVVPLVSPADATAPGAAPIPTPKSLAVQSGELGITLRIGAVTEAFREVSRNWTLVTWIVGRGALTSAEIGQRLQPWYNTVDNVFISVLYERGLLGLTLFISAFVAALYRARHLATSSIHWYAPLALGVGGLSFSWDAYSMFNILAVGSIALLMHTVDEQSGRVVT